MPLIICLVVYALLLIAALTLLGISLVVYRCRKEDLSVHGIVEKIVSMHVEEDNDVPNEQK